MDTGFTPAGGPRLLEFLESLPIKSRWIAGHPVNWQTGQQDGPSHVADPAHDTHCSAFVAAVALMLDIYVLRPPDFHLHLLSNAQVAWLGGTFQNDPPPPVSDWTILGASGDDGVLVDAVDAASAGQLVVAGYANPDATRPGHLAIVRPVTNGEPNYADPYLTTVGIENVHAMRMSETFGNHEGAWPADIQLFAHKTDLMTDVP